MPITTVEIVSEGTMASAGSNAVPAFNIFHYQITTPGAAPAIIDVLTNWLAWVSPTWTLAVAARYTQDLVKGRFLDDATLPYSSIAGFGVGTAAGDSLPTECSVYFNYAPGIRSRKARGNKKFAGAAEGQTTGDVLTGAGLVLWQNFGAKLIAPFTDSNANVWSPVVVSRMPPGQYSVNPVTIVATPTVGVLLNKRIGRMKRREAHSVY